MTKFRDEALAKFVEARKVTGNVASALILRYMLNRSIQEQEIMAYVL